MLQRANAWLCLCMTLAIMVLPPSAGAASDSGKAVSKDAPVIGTRLLKNAPPPTDWIGKQATVTCMKNDHDLTPSLHCFVVNYTGLTFWPYAFNDNRPATLMVGYDQSGRLMRKVYVCGPRYIWYMTVKDEKQQVVIYGQENGEKRPAAGAIPWSAFQTDGEVCGTSESRPK